MRNPTFDIKRTLCATVLGGLLSVAAYPATPARSLAKKISTTRTEKQKKSPQRAAATKTGYGWLLFETVDEDYDEVLMKGYTSINLKSGTTSNQYESNDDACAGAFANGLYYAYTGTFNANGSYTPKAFISLDPSNGSVTTVKGYSTMTTAFSDMTFDYSTQTMYALGVNNDGTKSVLATVSLTTGDYTAVKELDRAFITLAATYDGQLYAISSTGDLCTIDKTQASTNVVGPTGVSVALYAQSMEFDHTDETLYWAETDKSGSNLYTIDTATGKATKVCTLGYYDDAQIVGLYVPFTILPDGIPAAPQGLKATPTSATSTKLSWTNPTTTKGGEALQSITKVVITRDGTEITTLTGMTPGEEASYDDTYEEPTGWWISPYTYEVTAYNETGTGLSASATSRPGEDYPGKVENLKATKADGKVTLSWEAPLTGENGGWYDTSTLSYKIYRGSTVIEEKTTATTFVDAADGVAPGFYEYRIRTQTANKTIGADTYTDPIYVGATESVPRYYEMTTDGFKEWNVVDNNDDGETWEQETEDERPTAMMYAYQYIPADDWMVSRPLRLEAGKSYRVKYDSKCYFSFLPSNMEVAICKDGDPANAQIIKTENIDYTLFETHAAKFGVQETGDYSIAFHAVTTTASGRIYLASVAVEEFFDNDLAIDEFTAQKKPVVGKPYKYSATVRNNGSAPQSGYSADLVCVAANGTESVLKTVKGTKNLETDDTETLEFDWTFDSTPDSGISLKARVNLDGDKYTANNETEAIAIEVLPAGSDDIIELGKREQLYGSLPIGFVYDATVAQTIYYKEDIDRTVGAIKRIAWPYKFSTGIEDVKVKVYLGNTDRTNLKDEFISADQLTLVFDGTVTMIGDDIDHMLEITLERPYIYRGGNLCVMTEKRDEKTITRYGGGYASYDQTNPDRTRTWDAYSADTEFPYGTRGMSVDAVADITFYADVDGAKLKGKVTDDGAAMENAAVTISGIGLSATTNAAGEYEFDFIPAGEYTVIATSASDPTMTQTAQIAFNKGDELTKDFAFVSSGVEDLTSMVESISLYPVPADREIRLSAAVDSVRLIDNAGATALIEEGNVTEINVEALTSGIYHAVIEKDGFRSVKKVIVRH